MKVGITGVTGFIGSKLSSRLVKKGYKVVGFVRNDGFSRNRVEGVDYVEVDLASNPIPNNVELDVLINLASITPVRYSYDNSQQYLVNNLLLVQNVLQYLDKHKDTFLIHSSTAEVYPYLSVADFSKKFKEEDVNITGVSSPYAISKIGQEMLIHHHYSTRRKNYLIFRMTNTYHRDVFKLPEEARGYFVEKTVLSMLCGFKKISYHGYPQSQRQWIHYTDHVSMYEYALDHLERVNDVGNVINVAKDDAETLDQIVKLAKRYTEWDGEVVWGVKPRPVDPNSLLLDNARLKKFWPSKEFLPLTEGLNIMVMDYIHEMVNNREICSHID